MTITQANLGTLALGGSDAGSYNINTIASGGYLTVDITPKVISLGGTRLYTGTAAVAASDLDTSGTVGSETLTISGSGTINNAAAGSRTVSALGSLALGNGTNGGLGANYTLTGGTHTLTVNPIPLNITGSKVYDGDTDVSSLYSLNEARINNLISGENVLFAGFGESASANVGTQNVTQDGWTLSDQTHSASNYTFSGASMQIVIGKRDIQNI